MVPKGQDGVKGGHTVVRGCPAELLQLVRRGTLRHGDLPGAGLEPVHEPGEGHAVVQVGFAEIGLLHRVLHRLHGDGGVRLFDDLHPGGDAGQQPGVDPGGVQVDHLLPPEAVGPEIDPVVGLELDAVRRQGVPEFGGKGRRLGEKGPAHGPQGQIGQEDRGAGHVAPPQIQKPGDVLQGRQEEGVGPLFGHGGPDPVQLLSPGGPGEPRGQGPHRGRGKGRTVQPHLVHELLPVPDLHALLLGQGVVPPGGGRGDTPAVEAQGLTGLEAGAEEVRNRGHPRLPHLHELDASPFQLTLRLEKIPPVGPQPRPVPEDQQGPGGAGESGQPGPAGEVVPHILAVVVIGGGDEAGVELPVGHGGPESLEGGGHSGRSLRMLECFYRTTEVLRFDEEIVKIWREPSVGSPLGDASAETV